MAGRVAGRQEFDHREHTMLVVMKHNASSQEIRDVVDMVQELRYTKYYI